MFVLALVYVLAITGTDLVASQSDGTARIVGGTRASQGRVEVYLNGQWGTVCDDSWDLNDGNVICRQLGYTNASMVTSGATDGQGEGPINFSGLECKGNESNITECPTNAIQRICDHGDDAGVVCWPPDSSDNGGLSTGEIAAIVFVPFLLLIIVILVIIIVMLYLTLTYNNETRDLQERQYQEKRFVGGIKLKDQKMKHIRSRRQSGDSYLSESRNIPRSALGEGMAHPWQNDEDVNSEIVEGDVFITEADEQRSSGEVRQRVVSAVNPMVQINAEVEKGTNAEEERTGASGQSASIPTRYQKKQPIMSDDEIDKEFHFDEEDDDDDINPYEDITYN